MKSSKNSSTELLLINGDAKLLKYKRHYSQRQWLVFFTFCIINLGAGMCYSILAPFYPEEAEMRGVSSSIYGFVFGCFELVDFLVCPIFGRYIRVIGVKFMLNAGNFLLAFCTILFGFVDKMKDRTTFIVFSFLIRIISAFGQAGFLTASYAIIAEEFSDRIATFFSILETTFAIGMILGPTVGALLLDAGGFVFPFVVVGSTLLVAAFISCFSLPKIELSIHKANSLLKFLLIPGVSIAFYVTIATSFSSAFIFTLLEPHLRQFHLTTIDVGVVMVVNGISYAISAPLWGYVCDKFCHPKLLCGFSAILVTISFIFIGPAPFIPTDPMLWLTIVALVIQGIGASGEYVVEFLDAIREAAANNYPEDIETYAMISGLWLSGFSLGSFLGPSISGMLHDVIGFRGASMVVVAMHAIVAILCFGYYWNMKLKMKRLEDERNDKLSKLSLMNGNTITRLSDLLPLETINHSQ